MSALPLLIALQLVQAAPTDTLPMHRGQWAAQFVAGGNFVSLGLLRFRSPKHALVVDIRIEGGHGEEITTDSTGPHFNGLGSHADLSLRFGWRRYHPAGPKVAAFHSVGLLGGLTHSVSVDPGSASAANGWNAGVFGDIGGSYFLSSRLSVGATISAEIRYSDIYEHDSPRAKRRVWDLNAGGPGIAVVAALYF